jgi:F0F1-type ATP synthase membrane subunit b/b'
MGLWACLHWIIVPKFLSIRDKRKKSLEALIQQAKAIHTEAETLMKQNELRQEKTRQEARHIIQKASAEGEAMVRNAMEDFRGLYDQRIQNFHHELEEQTHLSHSLHQENLVSELTNLLIARKGFGTLSSKKDL